MRSAKTRLGQLTIAIGVIAAVAAGPADARRGGSFGSRGSRTYAAPRSTGLAPGYTPGVSRSMTSPSVAPAPRYAPTPYGQPSYGGSRPGLFRSFGGGLLTGVLAGGLIGGLFGHGWGAGYGGGGGGGVLAMLIQIAILAGIVWLAMRLFRGRGQVVQPAFRQDTGYAAAPPAGAGAMPFSGAAPAPRGDDIALTDRDQQAFETLLAELQDAFGHEDYGRLRAITTPEIMSYLSEELSQNATQGRRNDVSRTRLIDGEVSEAWREDDADYATVAMRYESVDVMKDRTTGAIVEGDPDRPTETTELWTFVRPSGAWSAWKVSAIQEVGQQA